MSLITSNYSISGQCRWLYASVALLLVIAQLISQLHSLESLEEPDSDTHSELSCNTCILTADLETNAPLECDSLGPGSWSCNKFVLDSNPPHFFTPSYVFDARAPPVVLQRF